MVKIEFQFKITDEIISGSFITDDKNGEKFINSKDKEKIIRDVINENLKVIDYEYSKC